MNNPYSIFPIGILSLVFYVFSYILVRIGTITISVHRQIWNTLLLCAFLVTASLGLILAIQVNYKIKLGITDQLLVWHVDFGIALAMIAIFHFLWHLNYYIKLFNDKGKVRVESELTGDVNNRFPEKNFPIENKQKLPVLALGMTAIITQVVLLREFMSIFHGNELVIGTILANWMILTGLGAYLGKNAVKVNPSQGFVFYSLFLSGIIPIATVILLNYLKNIVFPVGTMVGLPQIFISSLILLLPFCILSGFLFTFYASFLSQKYHSNLISKVYAIEATGSLGAGILYSFFLIYFFHSLQILSIISVINLIIALVYSRDWGSRYKKTAISISLILMIIGIFVFHIDVRLKGFLFPNQEIVYVKDTPFGNLIITESAGQKNFYENNVLLYSTDNVIGNEETVHFPMLQHSSPKKVLLIGGGISGLTNEILKYPVERIDYVEINPWIIDIGQRYTQSFVDDRIRTINEDARLFLRKTKEKYDIIIIDMPPPASAQVNRYFTLEFFRELQEKSANSAIISLCLPSTENYVSEEAARVQSVIYHTLQKVFKNITIIPGEKNYFIVSDNHTDLNISQLAIRRGIENVYVNQYYIDDTGLKQRSRSISGTLSPTAEINKDFRPVAYFMEIGYWMSYSNINLWMVIGIGTVLITLLLVRLNSVNFGLFTTGFTSSSMELLFIVSFQIIYGYVYQVLGVIITIFMAGLAIGALYQRKILKMEKLELFWKMQFGIAVFAGVIPVILILLQTIQFPTALVYLVFFLITLIISVFTGIQFSLASQVQNNSIARVSSAIYSVDLMGSAAGAFLVSVILFPILGLVKIFVLLAILNIFSGFISYHYSVTSRIN